MRRTFNAGSAWALGCLVVLILVGTGWGMAPAASSDEQQLRDLLSRYVKAVDTLDPELVASIWSRDAGVSFVHPRGTDSGFQEIRDDLFGRTMGTFSQRDLQMEKPAFHIYGDTAWSQMTWTFHATVKNGGQKITTTGRETQIYHKEDGTWRIVHVHYSGPPVTGAMKGF